VPSHIITYFVVFVSNNVNFIQSAALSLLVDCPSLFGIKGLQECS
jgi:hypothetical protein